jgi:hypothetical protein
MVARASAEMPSRRSPSTIAAMGVTMGSGVSGCTVGPEYQRPPIALEAFHSAGAVAARSAGNPAPPLDAWWIGFNDPQFMRIVQRALDQNLDFAAALARVEQARAAARAPRAVTSRKARPSALARWPRRAAICAEKHQAAQEVSLVRPRSDRHFKRVITEVVAGARNYLYRTNLRWVRKAA